MFSPDNVHVRLGVKYGKLLPEVIMFLSHCSLIAIAYDILGVPTSRAHLTFFVELPNAICRGMPSEDSKCKGL